MQPTQQIAELVKERARLHADLPSPIERRELREAAGLSQAELAQIVGVSTAAVGHWETGTRMSPRNPKVYERYVVALRALREGT